MPYIYGGLIGAAAAALVFYMVMQAQKAKENKITTEQPTPGTGGNSSTPGATTPPIGTQTTPATTTGETPATGARGVFY